MKTVVEHLSNLIRIPSVSSMTNGPVIEYAQDALHAAGWKTRTFPYKDAAGIEKLNLMAAPAGEKLEDAAELAFFCHTDTVPFAAEWKGALEPAIVDGNLHGCGACDVKGFLACLLTAIGESEVAKLAHGLRLVLTADEEVGCVGASRLLAAGAIRTRTAVVGEPTSLRAARAGKGYCLAEVTVFGKEAHSAHPHEGRSAIYSAARMITAIEAFAARLAEERHSFFAPDFTTVNVGTINGGTAKNIVPGQCSFLVEWRPIPGQSSDVVPDEIAKIGAKLREDDPEFRYEMTVLRQQPGFETAASARLVREVESLTGRAATSISFGSEASLLADLVDEVIVFGPGDMQTAHSNRECVPLSELDAAVECLKTMMR
jgi:acetylornithine deacetylase